MTKKTIRSQWLRVSRVKLTSGVRYMVDSRRSGFEPGRREFWATQAEASASAEQIERTLHNEGASSFVELTPAQRRDAAEALALIGAGGSLLDAVRCFVAERARLAVTTLKAPQSHRTGVTSCTGLNYFEELGLSGPSIIQRQHVLDYPTWRKKHCGGRNSSIHEIKFLAMLLDEAENLGYRSGANPARKLELKKEKAKEKAVWADHELALVDTVTEDLFKNEWLQVKILRLHSYFNVISRNNFDP